MVLVNPPQFTRYPQPPMGLSTIAAVLEKHGYPVTVLDANALRLEVEDIPSRLSGARFVGLTAMTPTINTAVGIARRAKQANPCLTIILGGAHATLMPEETLSGAPEIDVLVRGEGEETIIELVQALERGSSLDAVPGITFRSDGRVISNPPRPNMVDMDSLPFLAYHLLPWQRYRPHPPHGRASPFAAIITSRGCPYRCAYCSKPIFGSKFRAQSAERVAEEIAYYVKKFGTRELAFYDDVFTLNKKRAYDIADGMIRRGLGLCWTCETRVNLVDKELLEHMKRAGCYAVAYGIESASPDILDTLHKDINLEQDAAAIAMTREAGLQSIGYFMVGSPGETPETIRRTIDFAKKLKLDFAQFAVTVPFPGTELYEIFRNGRRDNVCWQDFMYEGARGKAPVFESEALSEADIRRWARKAYREFYLRPSYLWQRIRQMGSIGDLKVNINGLSMLLEKR